MALALTEDNVLLLSSILLGFFFGLYYEVFRFLRLSFPHNSLTVGIEDLLFFLPVTVIFLLFTYAFSSGVVRWFSVFGAVLGFLLYLCTLGKLLMFCSEKILSVIRKVLRGIWRFLLKPIFIVFKNITNCLYTKAKKFAIIQERKRSARKTLRQKKALIKRAEKGF